MDCDLLLSWMTHVEEGTWATFRNSVQALAETDANVSRVSRVIRITLSDLGFANFFIDGTQRWKILPPVIGGLAGKKSVAGVFGGRTPILVESLKTAAEKLGCEILSETPHNSPVLFRVEGDISELAAIANEAGILFETNLAGVVAQILNPIPEGLEYAPVKPAPLNWKVQSFDFDTGTWVEGLRSHTACEYTPRYGLPRYFVHVKRGKLLEISKRESLYAAAMLKGIELIDYEPPNRRLSVPLFAPLPDLYSRVACLCSGNLATIVNDRLIYDDVPLELAALIMVAAGQRHPNVKATIWRTKQLNG